MFLFSRVANSLVAIAKSCKYPTCRSRSPCHLNSHAKSLNRGSQSFNANCPRGFAAPCLHKSSSRSLRRTLGMECVPNPHRSFTFREDSGEIDLLSHASCYQGHESELGLGRVVLVALRFGVATRRPRISMSTHRTAARDRRWFSQTGCVCITARTGRAACQRWHARTSALCGKEGAACGLRPKQVVQTA